MTNEIIKVGTFFSGIGSPEKALERLKREGYIKDYKLEFFSEIDKNAIKSYCVIHNVEERLNLGSITDIKGKIYHIVIYGLVVFRVKILVVLWKWKDLIFLVLQDQV